MSRRVSHSVLDPWLTAPLKSVYPLLPLPRALPPEAIVMAGHVCAIAAAVGFAYSTQFWWGGLLVALGVAANHVADVLDGTHARATGQCRNGGELLDHFTDPVSFSYYLVGLAVSCQRLDLGLAAVMILFATAVLTNIKAKMTGEFSLASFGPTEFKALLILYGGCLALITRGVFPSLDPVSFAFWCFTVLIGIGVIQLLVNLVLSIREVNAHGTDADTSEWETGGQPGPRSPVDAGSS